MKVEVLHIDEEHTVACSVEAIQTTIILKIINIFAP